MMNIQPALFTSWKLHLGILSWLLWWSTQPFLHAHMHARTHARTHTHTPDAYTQTCTVFLWSCILAIQKKYHIYRVRATVHVSRTRTGSHLVCVLGVGWALPTIERAEMRIGANRRRKRERERGWWRETEKRKTAGEEEVARRRETGARNKCVNDKREGREGRAHKPEERRPPLAPWQVVFFLFKGCCWCSRNSHDQD